MYQDEKVEQKRVVVDVPGARREIVTERTEIVPRESGISATTVAIIAIVAVMVVGAIFYFVSSKNANEAANRNANLSAAANTAQPPATTIIQQPAAPAPVIIQQPAAVSQPAPIIIQQPAQPAQRDSSGDDSNMQEFAAKRLTDEPGMALVSITVSNAQAVLTGSVTSAVGKAKAERLVRAVRGVKSVDNQLVVSGV